METKEQKMMEKASAQHNRNYGIELLRVIATALVVMLHVLNAAGVLGAASGQTVKLGILRCINAAAMCAVNCYGIISGFVGYKSKFRIANIVTLWLQVAVYSIGISVLLALIAPELVSVKELIKSCMPVLFSRYWYFTAYTALFFVMPLLNTAIENMSRRDLELSLGGILLLFTVGQQVFIVSDTFGTNSGYSFVWLLVLYCVGGYIRKYDISFSKPIVAFFGYLCCILICIVVRMLLRWLGVEASGRLEAYNSPVMLFMAICLMLFCIKIQIPKWLINIVTAVAPASFGIYLIHTHPIVLNKLLKDSLVFLAKWPVYWMALGLIVSVLGIYVACMLIDWLRIFLFTKLRIKELLINLESKLLPKDGGKR